MLGQEHTGVENRALRRIFGPKREKVTGGWRRLHSGSFKMFTVHQVLLRSSHQGGKGGRGM
jgi:hypothetical protein